ncbi:MAG: sortase domain-bontaining protein [Lachnospiraceae bacterium]
MRKRRKILWGVIWLVILCIVILYCILYYRIYLREQKEHDYIKHYQLLYNNDLDLEGYKDDKKTSQLSNIDFYNSLQTSNVNYDVEEKKYNSHFPSNTMENDKDCIITIPDINLEKIVYTGSQREEYLKDYGLITANPDMRYKNGGNYIICGHASRLYGHSLNRLHEIKKGSLIQIQTEYNIDQYIVNEVYYENMNNTSRYCNQTNDRTITIISCAKNVSRESYIVVHATLKE